MKKKKSGDALDVLDVSADIQHGDKKIKFKANALSLVLLIGTIVGCLILLGHFGILNDILSFVSRKASALIQ